MNIQAVKKTPLPAKKRKSSGLMTTVIILLLIAIAVMGFMTVKRFFEAQQTTVEQADIKTLTDFVNSNPDNVNGRLNLAYAFQKAGQYDEARDQYLEVLKMDPKNQGAWYNLGEIARINKDYKEAETRLTWLMKNYEFHVLGSLSLAQTYIDTKRYDDAIKVMDKMIKGSPDTVDFSLMKGQALMKKGDKAKAKAAYQNALKYDPDNKEAKQAIKSLK